MIMDKQYESEALRYGGYGGSGTISSGAELNKQGTPRLQTMTERFMKYIGGSEMTLLSIERRINSILQEGPLDPTAKLNEELKSPDFITTMERGIDRLMTLTSRLEQLDKKLSQII